MGTSLKKGEFDLRVFVLGIFSGMLLYKLLEVIAHFI